MATKLQRAHAQTRLAHDTEVRKSQATGSVGQRLGGAKSQRSTPPQQDTEFAEILRQRSNTPPVHAKILPWVSGIETEGYQAPEGMFGPYDSQPPTRVQSIHDTPQPQRSVHPFAYQPALPFSALAGDSTENLVDARQRPESEVMSRGAGLRYFSRTKDATPGAGLVGGGGQETPMTDISPDMGTFGIQPSQENLPLPSVLAKAMPPSRKPVPPLGPPAGPLPSTPQHAPKEQTDTPQSTLLPDPPHPFVNIPVGQHVHHSHPEYPFDPIEAARKQEEAMRQARAEALATLESIQKHPSQPSPAGQAKGPRQTMETMTSDPSFGHLFHKDGVPMSRHMSLQDNPPMPIPVPPPVQGSGKQGMFGGGFYRIPFGVPMSVHLPRPLLVSRDSAGLGVGVGLPSRLAEIFTPNALSRVAESPESRQRKDDRSAYVETVHDEQEPADPTVSARHARSGAPTRSVEESAALAESGIQPKAADQASLINAERAPSRASTVQAPPPPPKSPSIDPQFRQSTVLPVPQVPAQTSHMATQGSVTPGILGSPQQPNQLLMPQIPALGTAFNSHPETRNISLSSQMPTVGTASPAPVHQELEADDQSTIAPTTMSNVKEIVNQSRFHDETLCQLLDAARLNLVGSEAKKALNRAARERVAELRALRDRGEFTEDVIIPIPGKKSKDRKSKDSKGKRSKKRSSAGHEDSIESSPPQWAQEIIQRLAAFDTRFAELEKQANEHEDAPSQDFAGDLIDDLLFNEINFSGVPPGLPGISALPIHLQAALGFPGGFGPSPLHSGTVTPRNGARLSTLSPDKAGANGELISWGSEVELPPPEERVTPPRMPRAPVINIQAPTESNIEKSQRALTPTQGTRTPKANTVMSPPNAPDIDQPAEMPMSHGHPVAMPDPTERNLPVTPAESIKSHRASPAAPHKVPLPPSLPSTGHVASPTSPGEIPSMPILGPTIPPPQSAPTSHHSLPPGVQPPMAFPFRSSQAVPSIPPPQTFTGTARTHNGTDIDHSQTAYKTAYENPKTPERSVRDRIHVNDPLALGDDPMPWDLVTQRLYSWALVWDEKSFVNALEEMSLGRQVDEFALSIFVMMTFKRMLRRNMSESPVRACDKLFVPPTMANAINQAVHSKNFKAGQEMLEELWYPFLFKDPPRIIIALSRHRNEPDQWTAHRYDLSSGSLRSYAITHEDKQLKDGRPFMWWHAIRLAWPQYNIPDPATLSQRLEKVHTSPENKDDNSLEALNYARNMFIGYRPERSADLTRLRENVWGEVKRLLQKKRSGHLVVDLDSPTHVDDL